MSRAVWILVALLAAAASWLAIRVAAREEPAEALTPDVPPPPPPLLPEWIPEPPAPLPPVELISLPSSARIRMGETIPIRFHLRNAGNAPVSVLRSLDGSEGEDPRYPRCVLRVADERGLPVPLPPMLGCGRYNPLRPDDFQTLNPGESARLDIYALWWKPPAPGAYTLTLTYDSSPRRTSNWHQEPFWMNEDVFRRLSLIPHERLSASARLDVDP